MFYINYYIYCLYCYVLQRANFSTSISSKPQVFTAPSPVRLPYYILVELIRRQISFLGCDYFVVENCSFQSFARIETTRRSQSEKQIRLESIENLQVNFFIYKIPQFLKTIFPPIFRASVRYIQMERKVLEKQMETFSQMNILTRRTLEFVDRAMLKLDSIGTSRSVDMHDCGSQTVPANSRGEEKKDMIFEENLEVIETVRKKGGSVVGGESVDTERYSVQY